MNTDKLFYLKTHEGYSIKILAELLQNIVKVVSIKILQTGIFVCMMDSQNSIVFNIELNKHKFKIYEINTEKTIGVNMLHFHKMLKSIKKKDSLGLYMKPNEDRLYLEIYPRDNDRISISSINIQYLQNIFIDLPNGYDDSIMISSNEYQRVLKDMLNISSTLQIQMRKYSISFSCMSDNIFTKNIIFGNTSDTTDIIEEETFSMELFSKTVKLAGIDKYITVFWKKGYPILLRSSVSSIGFINIYIKSKAQIEEIFS